MLVFGGGHLKGVAVMQVALEDDTLRQNYAVLGAKRLAMRFEDRKPDMTVAMKLFNGEHIVSRTEKQKVQKLLK